jgi:hypothetical protein
MVDLILLVALLIVGAIVIILFEALIFFLPAIVLALVVWSFTGSLPLAGVAFFAVALISILKRR